MKFMNANIIMDGEADRQKGRRRSLIKSPLRGFLRFAHSAATSSIRLRCDRLLLLIAGPNRIFLSVALIGLL